MTLKDFIHDRKVLYDEAQELKKRVVLPKYNLNWTSWQWYNRYAGRTDLKDLELFALGRILLDIRDEAKQNITNN